MTHKLDATVFVYEHKKNGRIKCEYIEEARFLEDDNAWEHVATLEPRMWIQYHWKDVKHDVHGD